MTNNVKSRLYKDSSEIPLNGGQVEVTSEYFDRSYDTSFKGISDSNIFINDKASGTISYNSGRGFSFGSDLSNELSFKTDVGKFNVLDNTICIRCGIDFYEDGNYDDIFRFFMDNSSGDSYYINYNFDSVNGDYEIQTDLSTGDANFDFNNSYSIEKSKSLEIRVVFDSFNDQVFSFVKDSSGWNHLETFSLPSSGFDKEFSFYVKSLVTKDVDLSFKDFLFKPVLRGLPDEVFFDFPRSEFSLSRKEFFKVNPQYPGKFKLQVHGTGKDIGESFHDSFEVLDHKNNISEKEFLTSPVVNYRVENENKVCSNKLNNLDNSSIDMDLECFCNSDNDFSIRFSNGGRLKKQGKQFTPFSGDFAHPEVQFKNNSEIYGRNLDPKDFGLGVGFEDISNHISEIEGRVNICRSLKMSNNDVCFYGTIINDIGSSQLIDFSLSDSPTGWRVGDARTGRIIRENSSNSSPPNQLQLEEGFYYFIVKEGSATVYFGDSSNNNVLNKTDFSDWNQNKSQHKLFFKVKRFRGYPFIVYYDFCSGTFQKNIINSKEVCLRTNSISAIETIDGNVSLIYEEYDGTDEYNIWEDRVNKLKYQKYDVSSNSFSNSDYLDFPSTVISREEWIHSFDVVKSSLGEPRNLKFVLNKGFSDSQYSPQNSDYKYFSPYLSELPIYFNFDLVSAPSTTYEINFDGDTVNPVETKNGVFSLNLNSLSEFYLDSVGFSTIEDFSVSNSNLFTENYIGTSLSHPMYPYFCDFIDLDFDEERGGVLVSVLNYRNRAPLIQYLDGDIQTEVCLPRFFDFYKDGSSGIYDEWLLSTFESYDSIRYTDIGSISSSFSSDGLIYSIASKEFKDIQIDSFNDLSGTTFNGEVDYMTDIAYDPNVSSLPLAIDNNVLVVNDKILMNGKVTSIITGDVLGGNELNGVYNVDSIDDLVIQDVTYSLDTGKGVGVEYNNTGPSYPSTTVVSVEGDNENNPIIITINLETDGFANSESTAQDIVDAVNNYTEASKYVTASVSGTSSNIQTEQALKRSNISFSRVSDYDQDSEINYGDRIYVKSGQNYGDSYQTLITKPPFDVGLDLLRYENLSWDEAWEKRSVEVGFINSNRIVNNGNVVEKSYDDSIGADVVQFDQDVNIVDGELKYKSFQTVPMFNMYGDSIYDKNLSRFTYCDLTRLFNYNLFAFGSDIQHSDVKIDSFVSSVQDQNPFFVPLDEQLSSKYQNSSAYNLSNVSYETSGDLLDYYKIESNSQKPSISRSIDSQGDRERGKRSRYADEGYRFRINFEPILNGGTFDDADRFEENLVFDIECYGEIRFGPLTRSKVQMVYDGVNVDCRVYNFSSQQYESVGYIKNVDNQRLQEFDVLVKHNKQSDRLFTVLFVVKDNNYLTNVVKSGNHQFDFTTSSKSVKSESRLEYVSNKSKRTNYSVYFDNDYKDTSDYINLYKMGWCKFNKDGQIQANNSSSVNVNNNSVDINTGYKKLPGRQYYNFDDALSFRSGRNYYPYGYKMAQRSSSSSESFKIHWPEGYLTNISEGSNKVFVDQEFSLNRDLVNNISNLSKDNLHSFYSSKDDNSLLTIYSDSSDHNLGEFIYDSVIVKGVNVPELDIVSRDDSQNSWNVLDTIDLSLFEISKSRISDLQNFTTRGQKKVLLRLDWANFSTNKFYEFDYYLYTGNSKIGKIIKTRGEQLVVQVNNDWVLSDFSEKFSIFCDTYVLNLDDCYTNKQVGIQFDSSFSTFEGHYNLSFFDFGISTRIPLKWSNDVGSGPIYFVKSDSEYVYDTQSFSIDDSFLNKRFNLEYSVIDAETLDKIKSLTQRIGFNRRPIYLIEDYKAEPNKVYVCFFDSELNYSIIKDFDDQKLYRASVSLRGIE